MCISCPQPVDNLRMRRGFLWTSDYPPWSFALMLAIRERPLRARELTAAAALLPVERPYPLTAELAAVIGATAPGREPRPRHP